MCRSLKITGVSSLPVTLQTVKAHLRVLHNDDDSQIGELIAAGVDDFERRTGRAFSRQTGTLSLSEFPDGSIAIPRPPLVSVESITYVDSGGVQQTLSPADYVVSSVGAPGLVSPVTSLSSWPVALERAGSVVVSFTAGDPAVCSKRIRHALLLWVDLHYHKNDETTAKRIESRIESVLSGQSLRHPGLNSLTVTD